MNLRSLFALFLLLTLVNNTIEAQQFLDETITYDGETRAYKIYVPASYDGNTPVPLLFNFHGGSGDIASQIDIADMRPIADTANFIIVYPQALPDPNDGGSTNWIHKEPTDVDDVFFVEAMINIISTQYEISQNRIYACGYSLGGEFTFELACRLSNKIAAVGVVARTMGTAAFDNCSPVHPTGIITILGTDDFISPYDGLEWNGIQYYLSAEDTHNYWVNYNNTSSQSNISQLPDLKPADGSTVEQYTWENGDGCVTVEHLKVNGGGHDWPGSFGNMDIDASLEIWNYVSRYNLDGLISCTTTSVSEERIDAKNIIIYPNPGINHLTINSEFDKNQVYQIYSTNGKLLLSGEMNSSTKTIDLSSLPQNSYILIIENTMLKFIKSK